MYYTEREAWEVCHALHFQVSRDTDDDCQYRTLDIHIWLCDFCKYAG